MRSRHDEGIENKCKWVFGGAAKLAQRQHRILFNLDFPDSFHTTMLLTYNEVA